MFFKLKLWVYRIIGAEKYYKSLVANRAWEWYKVAIRRRSTNEFIRCADDFFQWATDVRVRDVPEGWRLEDNDCDCPNE